MDYPKVKDGIYFVLLYKATERPIDGTVEVARYSGGYWEFLGNDVGLPWGMAVEVLSEINLPVMRMETNG